MVEWHFIAFLCLASVGMSDQGCDMTSPDYQRALASCNADLEHLHEEEVYKKFFRDPGPEELDEICKTYERSVACLKSIANTCKLSDDEAKRGISRSHRLILHTCEHKKHRTLHSLDCLKTQSPDINPLFKGCHDLLELKHKTALFSPCAITKEYIECEDRLLRSACGSDLADFALALSLQQKFSKLKLRMRDCEYIPSSAYKGFVYSLTCPPDFPVRMNRCYEKFSKIRVTLHGSLLAVIRGDSDLLNSWCSAFYDYDDCTSPIVERCPDGEKAVFDTENEWHRYVTIASYLCFKGNKDYKTHLSCYKKMLRVTTGFDLCRKVFDKFPTKWEAYRIKCSQYSLEGEKDMERRTQLIECFTSFIRRDCGANASSVIEPLLQMQYAFDFLPPCSGFTDTGCRHYQSATLLSNSTLNSSSAFLIFLLLSLTLRHHN